MVHTSRFAAYRTLIGAKAKSDTSDARLLAAYAAAPEEVRGRKAEYVVSSRMPCVSSWQSWLPAATNSST